MKNVIKKAAIEEIVQMNFGVTQQFLKIHEVIKENGLPKIARIDTDRTDGTAIVYFPIKNEKFYFAIYLDTEPEVKVVWAGSVAGNRVYFHATSEKLTLDEIKTMTVLKCTSGWNIGDPNSSPKKIPYKFSSFKFEPNADEADEVEDKIKKLLDHLEKDSKGVKNLVEEAEGYIQVYWESHNGNGILGGINLDKNTVKRLAALDLEIDFDLYAGGEYFKD